MDMIQASSGQPTLNRASCVFHFTVHQSFRVANEREPEAMLRLQQQLKPETLKDCQTHFAEAQAEAAAAGAAGNGTVAGNGSMA